MSIHDKMHSDYLWVRNAPVEEGLKVRYFRINAEITDSISCMIVLPMLPKDLSPLIGTKMSNYRSMGKQYDW